MTDTLLDAVRRYAGVYADPAGVARTPIAGLTIIRATSVSDLEYAISRPLVCLVVQGTKHVAMGNQDFMFSAGDSLLITADVPTVSQITHASVDAPYLSLVLDLDLAVVADLVVEMGAVPAADGAPVRVEPTEAEVTTAALRLMNLLDRPASVPVLQAQVVREMHYWLLAGRHGAAMRHLSWPDGHVRSVARGRGAPGRVREAVASRAPRGRGQHEPIVVPPALPRRDLALAAAVPEAAAPDRGAPVDDVGRRVGRRRRVRGRLQERVAVHAGVPPDVRLAAR